MPKPTSETKRWIRNESDELAVANKGCWFSEDDGLFVVNWIQDYCRLYEGEWAGQPMMLTDWQYEATMRMFGWKVHSKKWQRKKGIRRFRRASIWVPKKNKKSPTLAAWALYLLCGDDEPGQKVFLGAKDGKQAREIAGTHAFEMVQSSAALMSECTLNKSLMRITHVPSKSYMQPLSSSNARTQESKEGLNGCVLIDETHVVDQAYVDRISRAGISRSEPFQIEVSTAGNNPDGYGKTQYDYGKQVEAGKVDDYRYFYLCYEAPQTLTDAELDADPVKYGKIANPAMGHTVDEEEFFEDYKRSRASTTDFNNFKMYRLNKWLYSANPWLRVDDWNRCEHSYVEADLIGEKCYAALDLSRTRDLTAFCLAFPDKDEVVKYIWWYWLPETYAQDNAARAPFINFSNDTRCNFTLVPGDIIDFGYLRADIRKICDRHNVQLIVYDDWNAEKITQELTEGISNNEGRLIEKGLGIDRVAFSQTVKNYNEPAKEFERRVIDGRIHHNGDPCTAWQVGHCSFYEDPNGNIKPLKPKKDDVKKIDGIVIAVMGLNECMFDVTEGAWTLDQVGF